MSEAPIRYAVAVAVGSGSTFLFVRRPMDAAEFPGFWSLPTRSISAAEFARIEPGRLTAIPGFSCLGTCLNLTERVRADYVLHMALFWVEAEANHVDAAPELAAYRQVEVTSATRIVRSAGNRLGLCLSMLLQHLMVAGEIPSPQDYLELSPEHVRIDLDKASDAELWRMADFARSFVRTEGLERYGTLLKRATADDFVRTWARRLDANVVLDIGCGDGALAGELAASAHRVVGVDHAIAAPSARANLEFIETDFLSLEPARFADAELVVLNLVIQWLDSLDRLLTQLKQCPALKYVIVTFCPAEFSKNGYWVRDADGEWCWLVRNAMDEGSSLTMIDARIGPVRLYRRQLPTVIAAFARHGFRVETMEYLNLERSTDAQARRTIYRQFPAARRNAKVPQFVGCLFALG